MKKKITLEALLIKTTITSMNHEAQNQTKGGALSVNNSRYTASNKKSQVTIIDSRDLGENLGRRR